MIKFIDLETNDTVRLDRAIAEVSCPLCGRAHKLPVDSLLRLTTDRESIDDMKFYCEACSAHIVGATQGR